MIRSRVTFDLIPNRIDMGMYNLQHQVLSAIREVDSAASISVPQQLTNNYITLDIVLQVKYTDQIDLLVGDLSEILSRFAILQSTRVDNTVLPPSDTVN